MKAVFQSDREFNVPTKKMKGEEVYVLKKDGIEYPGRAGECSIIASFDIPSNSNLLGFDFEFTVTLQIPAKRRHVLVTFDYADLYQVYKLLTSTFKTRFRLKSFCLGYDLLLMWSRWPWNMDFLLFQFKNNPEETLSFVKAHLPELITTMSLRKVPRQFDEPFKFVVF